MTENEIPAQAATNKTLKELKGIKFRVAASLDPRLTWFAPTFNSIYEDACSSDEINLLFTDVDARTIMVQDPVPILKRLFATSMTSSATATDPDRTARITTLLQECTLIFNGRRHPELF